MAGALLVSATALRAAAPAVPSPGPYGAAPSARQLKWHELEVYGMVNFSTITYCGKEWGYGDEDAAKFNPTEFDALQIVRAAKAGGMRGLVIDAKHHGGFCLWPSKYTEYSVKNCPWKNGKGDMVKELVDACRAEGLQVSMYLSPWDRNHKDYGKPEYVTYYRNQLTELLTNYGPVFEVWLDGANGGDGYYGGAKETRTVDKKIYYDWPTTYALIHKLQPDANIFSEIGSELRWNGNESGVSGDPCWATFTPKYRGTNQELKINPATGYFYEIPNGEGNYTEATNGHRNGNFWMPAEADFPLRDGWFWHPGGQTKSPSDLVNRYFTSVGRNSAMDIGIAPDRRGLIDEPDRAALKGFGERIAAIFKINLAQNAKATASNVRGNDRAYAAANVLNGKSKFKTYWAADDGIKDAELVLDFGRPTEFSVVSLREAIQLGHRIDNWALDSWQNGQWTKFAAGAGIGARRLWRGQSITSEKIRLRIIQASACPAISEFAVYLEPESSRKEAGGLAVSTSPAEPVSVLPQRPVITKTGTLGLDLCESTPFVFQGKVYRLEWFRNGSYLRIMDRDTHKEVSRFGQHHRFPCAYVKGDTVYVIGTKEDRGWFGNTLTLFTSKDLLHWDEQVAFQDKDYGICNTSVCKADGRFVMSIEVNRDSKESLNGSFFSGRFLESKDGIHWTPTRPDCRIGFDGNTKSPHLLRWHDGWFYLFSTVGGYPTGYVLLLERSRDLKTWEASPFNPVMAASPEDKLVLNPLLTEQERSEIAKNGDSNNSDIDFCEFNGKLIINYCWGTQGGPGHEYLAEAEYAGTEAQFLTGWFPTVKTP
jgi:alpha-L-fucosidase